MENISSGKEYNVKNKNNLLITWIDRVYSWNVNKHRYSIAYSVIKYSFFVGAFLSIAVAVNCWIFGNSENKVPDITKDLTDVWNIVIPIITFAIGHIFGKQSD